MGRPLVLDHDTQCTECRLRVRPGEALYVPGAPWLPICAVCWGLQ